MRIAILEVEEVSSNGHRPWLGKKCSCPLSPDEIITGSVSLTLASNLLINNGLHKGVIKIISSAADKNNNCVTGEIPVPTTDLRAWLTRRDSIT